MKINGFNTWKVTDINYIGSPGNSRLFKAACNVFFLKNGLSRTEESFARNPRKKQSRKKKRVGTRPALNNV